MLQLGHSRQKKKKEKKTHEIKQDVWKQALWEWEQLLRGREKKRLEICPRDNHKCNCKKLSWGPGSGDAHL